jgi:hypothetical protein
MIGGGTIDIPIDFGDGGTLSAEDMRRFIEGAEAAYRASLVEPTPLVVEKPRMIPLGSFNPLALFAGPVLYHPLGVQPMRTKAPKSAHPAKAKKRKAQRLARRRNRK